MFNTLVTTMMALIIITITINTFDENDHDGLSRIGGPKYDAQE